MALESRKGAALEDPGAEVIDQLTGFWDRYGRILLGAIGAVVVIAVVTVFTMRSRRSPSPTVDGGDRGS